MTSLKNKVVLITGASSGIGKAATLLFAKEKSKLIITARRLDRLEELKKKCSRYKVSCLCVKTDVTDENSVKNLFKKSIEKFGRVDILINNAGIGLKKNICDIELNEWNNVLSTNLTGLFLCTKEFAKTIKINKSDYQKKQKFTKFKKHIINISSVAGLYSAPSFSAYCASKHGVTGFARSAKFEFRGKIKVSTIFPFRIDTEFFDSYGKKPGKSQMLTAVDLGKYIVAVAKRNLLLISYYRLLNIFKRIYYAVRYLF